MKVKVKKSSPKHIGQCLETLEPRRLLNGSPEIASPTRRLFFSDIRDNNPAQFQNLILRNPGSAPLILERGALKFTGSQRQLFFLTEPGRSTIAPGGELAVPVRMQALPNTPLDTVLEARLEVRSNAANAPLLSIRLRALATPGEGGTNEPSLARLMQLHEIPIDVGDDNPSNIAIDRLGQAADEIFAPQFVRAASGPVSLAPLAAFTVKTSTTAARIGTYSPGTRDSRVELHRIGDDQAQTVAPTLLGSTRFDPGTNPFSVWGSFPGFTDDNLPRIVYSEDALNIWEPVPDERRKVRVFLHREPDGQITPNTYVITFEEWDVQTDQNDLVYVLRNVQPALGGPEIGLENRDLAPAPDRLVFSRIQNPNATFGNSVKEFATARIHNTGNRDLVINAINLSGTGFQIQNTPTLPLTIKRRGFFDLTVRFTATSGPIRTGSISINSNDRSEPLTTINLAGLWQSHSETLPGGVTSAERTLQQIVEVLGYRTAVTYTGQNIDTAGVRQAVGDEVLSSYWKLADPGSAAHVIHLASFHTVGSEAQFRWWNRGDPDTPRRPFISSGSYTQTLFPNLKGENRLANGTFQPTGEFGIRIDSEYSDPQLNIDRNGVEPGTGHHFRFFPLRDSSGRNVPHTWLMTMDYRAFNYDYNDNIYLISNITPADLISQPENLNAWNQNGVNLNWAPVNGAAGYHVLRSPTATGRFSRISSTLLSTTSFIDNPTGGRTWHYRVVAIGNDDQESTPISTSISVPT